MKRMVCLRSRSSSVDERDLANVFTLEAIRFVLCERSEPRGEMRDELSLKNQLRPSDPVEQTSSVSSIALSLSLSTKRVWSKTGSCI